MRVSLAQTSPQLNRSNLERATATVKQSDADVVVFSELALNGYMLQDKVFEDAFSIEELSSLNIASLDRDIVVGAAIKVDGRTYNSALYFSKGELLHIHHKVHLPNYGMFEEARYFFRGNDVKCFDTQYGKCAMLVCEDLWSASVIAKLAELKPDIVYVLAASPSRDFSEAGLLIETQWNSLLSSTALLCSSYVVFVNRVGFEDGLGFWGGSRVITPKGEVEYRLENFKDDVLSADLNHRLHNVQKWIAKKD
ncbi:MAG: nitrilase-related carbon-nitrogen hydrolase [Campylobacterota bacterium]|nr:nitrilase-related carbon-nitrogen hydrolase [Campylobacterota bacterium]